MTTIAKFCKYNDEGYQRLVEKMKLGISEFKTLAEEDHRGETGKNGYGYLTKYTEDVIKGVNIL